MVAQIDIHLPNTVVQHWQQAQNLVNTSVQSITNSAQQVGESLKTTATQAASTTLEQAKESLSQSLQTAEQIQQTTSAALKTAIASQINDWLAQHPIFLNLLHILNWAANHPIISFILLLFILALIWSIISAIIRLIIAVSWSVIQIPLKLLQTLIKASLFPLFKLSSLSAPKTTKNLAILPSKNSTNIYHNKQQRLAEISSRLEAIKGEQNQLLQEAADLIK
ncbi:hypothetical protein [Fortiea contorta]|uniref:hypothetical protein n=1 Tax=Fortiea contorta TaxID=1892405 RepID=UPI00034CA233|nr:hypothetical protein [Fortiea contorta]